MGTASTKDKLEFVFAMAKHSDASVRDCEALMRYGATLGRLAEDLCNGADTSWCRKDADYDRAYKDWQEYLDTIPDKTERIRGKVEKICLTIGADAVFGQDPRGCTLKIATRDGYTNDMGREGICVPTS